jgi:hypothetical protein
MAVLVILGACVTGESIPPTESSSTPPRSTYPLVATDDVLEQQCQEAADLVEFPVPCPAALPATNNPVRCVVPGAFRDANVTPKEGCALGDGFLLAPTGIQDLDLYHLLIEGQLELGSGCLEDESHTTVETVHGQGLLFTCSEPGLHEGHTLVRLEIDNVIVNVSAHGHTEHNEQAVLAIADAIQMIPPG